MQRLGFDDTPGKGQVGPVVHCFEDSDGHLVARERSGLVNAKYGRGS